MPHGTHSTAGKFHLFKCAEEAESKKLAVRHFLCDSDKCDGECKEEPLRPEFDDGVRRSGPVYHGECLNSAGTNTSWGYACGKPYDHHWQNAKARADKLWERHNAIQRGEEL